MVPVDVLLRTYPYHLTLLVVLSPDSIPGRNGGGVGGR